MQNIKINSTKNDREGNLIDGMKRVFKLLVVQVTISFFRVAIKEQININVLHLFHFFKNKD